MQDSHWLGLQGRACAVTGAARGIGRGIAQALADAGARVALLDYDAGACEETAAALRAQGADATAFACDTSDPDSVARAATAVHDVLGPCAGLVNNAGILRSGALQDVELQEWNRVLDVNLTGYLLTARTFAARMRDGGGGSIVHIASISGSFPQTRSGAYSASKAGVMLMSRQMAVEWGADGIRSNTVCPGMIRTHLSAAFYAEPGNEQKRAAMTASRRVGETDDIANAALFLLSPRSSYINAADLAVNGGMDAMLMDMVPRPGFNHTAAPDTTRQ
ncbi:SDR family NAD(P)-dependent oxidoreductase [Castellaniella denitrificans]|jgi:NAD(P)-dependent dehydrogenase (short-subunit alcohol dehydrogenase family)|uniref:SDR family NAD(P)-dependent oxidoreductase n=1 Tax=Castellaniella denitrificans TaxID=56119 RepID=UPI001AC76D5A|nr:SDR family oxidoreductase [Burkholderiales bacterium]